MTTPTIRLDMYLEAGELSDALAEEPAFLADVLVIYRLKTKGAVAAEIAPAVVGICGPDNARRVAAQLRDIAAAIEKAAKSTPPKTPARDA